MNPGLCAVCRKIKSVTILIERGHDRPVGLCAYCEVSGWKPRVLVAVVQEHDVIGSASTEQVA